MILTFKYGKVRSEIYERNSNLHIKKYRTIKEIIKIFRTSFWALIMIFIIGGVSFLVVWWLYPQKWYCIIPGVIVYFVPVVAEFYGEKIYIGNERKRELQEVETQYSHYILEMENVLINNGIDTVKKREVLKMECMERLKKQEAPYKSAVHSTIDTLIAIPLGALVSSIISNNSENIVNQIIVLVIFGCLIVGILKFVRTINFYSDGYFKDKLLLNVLNELEYCSVK